MGISKEKDLRSIIRIIRYTLIGAIILGGLYGSAKLFPYLMPIFMGMLIAEYARYFSNLLRRLWKRLVPDYRRHHRFDGDPLAIVLYYGLMIGLIMLVFWGITAGLGELLAVIRTLPQAIENVDLAAFIDRLSHWIPASDFSEAVRAGTNYLVEQAQTALPALVNRIANFATASLNALPLTMLVIVISVMSGYYSLSGTQKIYMRAVRMIQNRVLVRNLFDLLSEVIRTIFRIIGGYILLTIITFVEVLLGLVLIGFPNAWVWALITSVVDVLPILGSSAVLLPISVSLFLTGKAFQGAMVFLLLAVITVARRMWEPLILGRTMKLHPLSTIFSMIFGILFWGLSGVLFGPLYFVTITQFLSIFSLEDKLRGMLQPTGPKESYSLREKMKKRELEEKRSKEDLSP